ncbi:MULTISPECIES: undecaprenyl-phosphate glucose phosphotransferase [unclassified Halomonas]|uniref:undecaprenyl-phosphate glucose phosphotransferase n=1 Tax=unclassified Halomonas TaxID=2609666 RepID=UPI0021E39440|nr:MULTISPECIES: undecaprenyl-phosphate glucose phosphotransferase [unclassified Halomonas]UYF98767.1 undecaprenyl-phosphate glucose phosphotransferase [Halomonas sp. GD1P12]WNL40118.1 undecaprenyl-phosphate glucose phosphotransferase [Halomonas sp. PAMB 3232]WNL43427.1 undecaprenyl-phosphate glucose phosphotransferase [Halomonas sp. PAMB 3264]
MRCFDAGIALVVSWIALWVMPNITYHGEEYMFIMVIGSLLLPAVGELLGLYQPWRGRSLYSMLGAYALSWCITIVLISLLLVATQTTQNFSRLWMGVSSLTVLGFGSVMRGALYIYLRRLRAQGKNCKRIVIIGREENLLRLKDHLLAMLNAGYMLHSAKVDDDSDRFHQTLKELVDDSAFNRDFDEIWLSYPLSDGDKVRLVSTSLIDIPISVRYFPDLSDIRLLNHRMVQVVGLYSLELNYSPLDSTPLRLVKNIEDRLIGGVLFIAFLPVMLVIAALVKWKMGGPVLFKQHRHGIDGKRFRIYKFRSMSVHQARTTVAATREDPRITPLGAFLRRTSLDELPQLYNVLQGRMSLVGPRPHALDHNQYYQGVIQNYMQRHRVKPGMTGWAQVNGHRGTTDTLEQMQKRVEFDLYYIDNWSLGLDLKILIMTLTRGFANSQP